MISQIPCPNCGDLVDPQARSCSHCGVDLALAAVLAERSVVLPAPLPTGTAITPEILVPRLGEYLLERGVLSEEQLNRALRYKYESDASGKPLLVGQALLELGFVNRETLDQVVTVQILQLQAALSKANRELEHRVQERTQELQQALNRLSELNQLKSNFIANISHELRTPLTHLKGYLDLLASGGDEALSEDQLEIIAILQRAEGRLERLIEDLIEFSLASRGSIILEPGVVQLDKLILATVQRVKPKARAAEVSLNVILPPNMPLVRVDEDKIGWVLLQLLDNALKFTPHGGRVEVEASLDHGLVTVFVTDTGIGIPNNRLEEIFEPFHQLDSSTTRRYGGTGLGLSMTRKIIEAHGSQIKVQSAFGRGSRFEFSIPALTANEISQANS